MENSGSDGYKGKLNTRTFAIRDSSGNIWVTVPVLLSKERDPGYPAMAKHFNEMTSDAAVQLPNEWCDIEPLNSSTNTLTGDDDDDK